MTNYPLFPIFTDHDAAKNWGCYQCGTKIPRRQGDERRWADSADEYLMKCPRCGAGSIYQVFSDFYGGPLHEHKRDEVRANYEIRK